jgi:hypothetical protein
MAYTLANLQTDIRNYTEVDDTVFTSTILNPIIVNAENKIYREVDSDQERFYATSSLVVGNRYVTIPADLRFIRYAQLTDSDGNQYFLEQRDTSFMAEYYATPGTASVNIPKYYANWDETYWVVAPTLIKHIVLPWLIIRNLEALLVLHYLIQPILTVL